MLTRLYRMIYTPEPIPFILLMAGTFWCNVCWGQYLNTTETPFPSWVLMTKMAPGSTWVILWTIIPLTRLSSILLPSRSWLRTQSMISMWAWVFTAYSVTGHTRTIAAGYCWIMFICSLWVFVRVLYRPTNRRASDVEGYQVA